MSKTKQEIIAQVKKNSWAINSLNNKTEDINALWHWCRCLEKENNKLKEKVQQLHEEINNINTKSNK